MLRRGEAKPVPKLFQMIRFLLGMSALCLATAGFPALGQDLPSVPSKEQRTLLLETAVRRTNLWAEGSAPFHLRANVVSYGAKGEIREGRFELWWASPERFRDEINWGEKSSVRIADKNSMWIGGSDVHRLDTFRVTTLIGFASRLMIPAGRKVERVQAKRIDGVSTVCMQISQPRRPPDAIYFPEGYLVQNPDPDPSECLDAVTHLPLWSESGQHVLKLGDYAKIGDKEFPRKLVEFHNGKPAVEIVLDLLEPLDVNAADVFRPAGDMIAKPWCANMILPNAVLLKFPEGIIYFADGFLTTSPVSHNWALLVFQVDESGNPKDVRAFTVSGEATIKDQEKRLLLQSKFSPASCDSKSLQGEFLLRDYPLQSRQ